MCCLREHGRKGCRVAFILFITYTLAALRRYECTGQKRVESKVGVIYSHGCFCLTHMHIHGGSQNTGKKGNGSGHHDAALSLQRMEIQYRCRCFILHPITHKWFKRDPCQTKQLWSLQIHLQKTELVLLNRVIMGIHYPNYTLNRQTQQLLKICLF